MVFLLLPRRLIKIMRSDMFALHTDMCFTISTFKTHMFIYLQGIYKSFFV